MAGSKISLVHCTCCGHCSETSYLPKALLTNTSTQSWCLSNQFF